MSAADSGSIMEEVDYRSAKYWELEGLIGSKRGDTIKGMNEVKKILNKEGYMDSYNPLADDNDNFDDKLEAALHVYHYYNDGCGDGIIDSITLEVLENICTLGIRSTNRVIILFWALKVNSAETEFGQNWPESSGFFG